jgi:hypothetical protein
MVVEHHSPYAQLQAGYSQSPWLCGKRLWLISGVDDVVQYC